MVDQEGQLVGAFTWSPADPLITLCDTVAIGFLPE